MISLLIIFYLLSVLVVVNPQEKQSRSISTSYNVTRQRRFATDSGITCTLPPHPKNGRWIVVNGDGREGEIVGLNALIKFYCKTGYKLSGKSPYRVCDQNWNTKRLPECLKLCPPILSTSTVTVKCTNRKQREIDCDQATDEAYLSYTCAPFYEAPFGYKTTFLCSDGDWNSPPPICQPVCGRKVHDDTTPLIYGGKVEEVIEYPWIATVFRKEDGEYTNICGGSILSQKLVLTAAHCVTNGYGDPMSEEEYLVAAAKLHNKYNDSRDPHAQYLNILHIVVHPSYKGENRRYSGDIAILVTKELFVLNKFVQPVCFNDLKNINLQVGTIGVVAGFGINERGLPSEELRSLEIPYKSEATCARELPGDWGDRYNVIDKLCAGFYNKSMSICRGDSGNGLFFRNPDNSRYYVHGIVSLGHAKKGQCNVQTNSLYTKVAFHYEFVDREVTKYYLKDCALPPYPDNGKWVIETADKKPGDTVPSSTIMEISCNEGYKLSSDNTRIKCESSFIMPTCQRLCPEVHFPIPIGFNCTNKEGELVSCNEATDEATLSFTCPKDYKIPDGTKRTRQCLNGAWELPTPSCQRIDSSTEPVVPEDDEILYMKIICVYDDSTQYDTGAKPEDLDPKLCTHVMYNSVGLFHDGSLRNKRSATENGTTDIIRSVADMKKRNGKLKVLVNIFGSGLKPTDAFPVVAGDPVKRSTFVANAVEFLETYGYDGLNIHWKDVLKDDQSRYIALLSELKESLGKRGWLLSTTIYYAPEFLGYSPGNLYEIVDWTNLESYNLYNEWSKYTGQNSALYPSTVEGDYESHHYNLQSAIESWNYVGMKYDKMSAGIAFFGRYYTLQMPRKHGIHAPVSGGTGSDHTGLVTYSEICEKYKNWTRVWDEEQKNPYKYYKKKWVGYDDKDSVKLKAAHIEKKGLFGVTVYPVNGDDVFGKCGPKQVLLKHVRAGLGDDTIDLES